MAATMMQTCSSRVWHSKRFSLAAGVSLLFILALGTIGCAHHASPPPTQAQAPTVPAASPHVEASTQAPLRANCGGINQPPCSEPSCGTLGNDCCTGNLCRGGLVCKGGTCFSKNSCGGIGEACCVNLNPVCSNYLLKCIDNICSGGKQVSDLSVTLRTNDEDKDDDTGVRIAIDGMATWSQTDNTHYDDWSTHTWSLSPSVMRLDDLAGRYVSICMQPNGDDTWKFNFLLQGNRDDGLKYEIRRDNVFLSSDVPCLSWDATPDPTPSGTIVAADGKCLTITNGGALGSVVALNACAGGADQRWILVPKVSAPLPDGSRTGEIRRLGNLCLDAPHGLSLPEIPKFVVLQSCNGSPTQQWKWFGGNPTQVTGNLAQCLDPNGQGLVVVSTGTSPALAEGVDQTQHFLQYVGCDGTPSQSWTLPACGAAGQACCDSGMPCQGTLGCKKGACTSDPVNLNAARLTLETSNEDKDDDTQASVAGLWSWPGDGKTHYDDWSTHQASLTPSSTLLSNLAHQDVALRAYPNGDDSWKLNFVVDAVRDDGAHYEFRKDNVWMSNEGSSSQVVNWQLRPPPLDLQWKDTDANGLPLNPTWRYFDTFGACENGVCLEQACVFHASPLADDLNDYGRCTSQSPTYDRSWLCGWHVNWFPVAFDGTIACCGGKNPPLYHLGDDDFHVDLSPPSPTSNVARTSLVTEFDSDETTDHFASNWWNGFDDNEHVHALVGHDARIIGLMGIDTEHGPHAELHPVYVFTVRAPGDKILGGATLLDTWGVFIRNWGNEGACGGSQHYLELTQFTLRFAAPPGAENATSVVEQVQTNFHAGSESGSDWSGFSRTQLSPVQKDANGTFVEMTFNIGPPEDHTFFDGSLSIGWKCGSDYCPAPPTLKSPTPPVLPLATAEVEDEDEMAGADLLTLAQLNQLQAQFPPPGKTIVPSRPIQVIPFTTPAAQAFKVGQGSLTDRTVPDLARQQRTQQVQKNICTMLPNATTRPAICNSLP
jgi:hypothetical protein